jgi:hypothetical protein
LLNLLVNHNLMVLRYVLLMGGLVHVEIVGVLDRFAEVDSCSHCLRLLYAVLFLTGRLLSLLLLLLGMDNVLLLLNILLVELVCSCGLALGSGNLRLR